MRNYQLDTQNVAGNVKLEVIYEANPCFAGECVQAVLRLRHLGSPQIRDRLDIEMQALKQGNEESSDSAEDGGNQGLMSTFFRSFNKDQKAREVQIRQKRSRLEKDLEFHRSVSLTSCYVQIFGLFRYDPETLAPLQSDNSGSKLVGTGSLKISGRKKSNSEGLGGILFANLDDVARESMTGKKQELQKKPILLVPQTLVFSEIMLEPGEVRSFQFRSPRLPPDLPPSYKTSKNFKIQYYLNFGLTKIGSKGLTPFNTDFQIHVCPFVDAQIRQFTSKLDAGITILAPGRVKEVKDAQRSRRKSSSSILLRRRSSAQSVNFSESVSEGPKISKDLFKKLIQSRFSSDEFNDDIEGLVDKIMECQFETNNYESSEGEDTNSSQPQVRKDMGSVRENLNQLYNGTADITNTEENENEAQNGSTGPLPQIKSLQKEFIINRNGEFVGKVRLANSFYTTSDDIDLAIDLANEGRFKISAVTTSLKAFELINPKYATEALSASIKQQGQVMDENRAICFEETPTLHIKLLPHRSPTNQITSQFRTDVFQFKWMLCLKFVLLNRVENEVFVEEFYGDKNGSLSHAKQSLDGEVFSCHIPLTILPSSKNFGAW
ncbi:Rgp1p [Lachancea thermotolerans CBS 6340]|uniref:KLTH0G12672p n=1 Tax=Lachancea thermotolerans (strain ATCC 56472 / CBS 6340 / NRRL Y-8284) TaxID=559295 RepID=C5DMY6_LACTC|nr:KLTH0G12672p [Lachancea thermotolerans CBS 6340]CAR25147.1 KLTH0G12672p [Lachancea thermotolerans CBS 6340]